ncbi:MAG: hypothetical protein L6R36_001889 [Xanthoria steineri]|nr:MAG: hypothetical protein L6R36_001889 [Xanthoria steineri]
MTQWLRQTRYLLGISLLLLVARAGAHESQSTAITIDPGQSIVQSAQLTLPVVTTTTAVSVVTVTQMSMQTTTAVVTQMQTVVVAATCAAASPAAEPQNSQEVVTARPLDTNEAVSSPAPTSSTPASVSSAALVASSASPERCDCSCLCPMAAFPMAAYQMALNTTQAVATSSTQMSTFTTVVTTAVTTAVGNLIVESSVGTPNSTGDAKATASTPSAMTSSISQPATIPTKVTGALPSDIVTDPAVRQKNAQDAPFDINNYALMTSVNLPVIVSPAAEPTAGG